MMKEGAVVEGRYTLLRSIGGGGMGTVWLAEDGRLKRQVAVKSLRPDLAHDTELRTRFESEAQAMAKINHPHVAEIYDVGSEGEQPFIVMEYVRGETLTAFLRDHAPLPELQARRWLESIARGVAAIHRRQVIHRDLKPNNILLPEGGEREYLVKIVDFGIARNLASASITGELGRLFLTPQYASPEQIAGAPLTPASDVYTLGVLFYELLGGLLPVNPATLQGRLAPGSAALLAKMLQPDTAARPQDGAQLLALIRHLEHADESTRPEATLAPAPVSAPTPTARNGATTRLHPDAPPAVAPTPAKSPSFGDGMRARLESIRNRPAEELSPVALLVDLMTFIGAGLLRLSQGAGRGIAAGLRRLFGVSPARSDGMQGAAGGALNSGIHGLVNGLMIGAIGGAVGGFGGWFFWSLTHLDSLYAFGNALMTRDPAIILSVFLARIASWSLTASLWGALIGAMMGFALGAAGAGEGTLGARALLSKMLRSLASAVAAVWRGLFLTFTHLFLAAIPLTLWAISENGGNIVLLRFDSFGALLEDLCYWAALGAIGWGITLPVDTLFDHAVSRSRLGLPAQLLLSPLLGALALGSGSFILWLVLSAVGLGEALHPETIWTHIRYDVAIRVGLLGGLLIALLRRRRAPQPPTPLAPTPQPPRSATLNRR